MKQRGMTLLEVMVALTIFSIAAVSIAKSLSAQISNMPVLKTRTLAQWVADNQMVETLLVEPFPEVGEKRGDVEQLEKTWYWKRVVEKTNDEKFRKVTILISEDSRYERITMEVSSYVAKLD
ncbi:type II secretion system minor pseudopilin GspI [Paraferrimonas sedimenticola]|uniref:Type II secretion system protein I n=1 Tax=Paraferrimonas sedimenticola TaxID=375674 RepID=A0AA37W048_9GAMM|nr:type II secretion system minor pseudopilin GspI [Paraferrimonas sedimenticola]GLP95920.1 type II secretion system protein GspI [Paraferrimonas sedimenticola]